MKAEKVGVAIGKGTIRVVAVGAKFLYGVLIKAPIIVAKSSSKKEVV